jgi:hypothetical protein
VKSRIDFEFYTAYENSQMNSNSISPKYLRNENTFLNTFKYSKYLMCANTVQTNTKFKSEIKTEIQIRKWK